MDLEKCYKLFGGDLEDALARLMNGERIERFLLKFADMDECGEMLCALENKDYKTAFMKAHDIKGTSANLAFTALFESSSALCEAIRNGQPQGDITPLIEAVCRDNKAITDAVKSIYG